MFRYPYGSNLGVIDRGGLNIGIVGYFRKLKMQDGQELIVNIGGSFRDGKFPPRGQGYEEFGLDPSQ